MIGGEIEKGEMKNREDLLDDMKDSVEGFAQFYISLRAKDKSYKKADLLKSYSFIESCAQEVCEIFLDGLLDLRTHPNSTKFKAVTDPNPIKPKEKSKIEKAFNTFEDIIEQIKKKTEK